jgi:tetratricopeptide (TPR) repeat protein
MKKRFFSFCLIFLFSFVSLGRAEPQDGQRPLVLANVNVIDATGAPMKVNMTVVIKDGRITEIGEASRIRTPQGARVVDARDKFLIPGLWDMHVHCYDETSLSLFIANGVTGVRQMFGFPFLLERRQKAEKGELLAPRQMIASPLVDGQDAVWNTPIKVGTVTEARQAVLKIKNDGYDFVKVYSLLSRDVYFAIADESKKQGLVFGGHVPFSVTVMEASDAGQKHIEHLSNVLLGCSTAENKIRREIRKVMAGANVQEGVSSSTWEVIRSLNERLLDTYDKEKAAALFSCFVKNGTWQCPTRTARRSFAFLGDADFRNDPRLKYMPKAMRDFWQSENHPFFTNRTSEDYAMSNRIYQKTMEVIQIMKSAGVNFLAGTDAIIPFCFYGFSLHDELALLVEAGLTPMEALQSATLNPAVFMGTDQSLGTVEKGKLADLVLLDANPLENIGNTKRIAAVILNGELFEKLQLEAMLANAEKLADQKSIYDALRKTIEKQGVAAAVRQYYDLRTQEPDAYDFSESQLNSLGYNLLRAKKVKDAIEIFKLNVVAYPQSSNVFDSLGEAYMVDGDKENAIANYLRSLELNPRNAKAIKMLKKLGK